MSSLDDVDLMNGEIESTDARQQRFSAIELLFAITAMFVLFPLIENLQAGALIESILLSIVLVSAVLAISAERRVFIIAALLAAEPGLHHRRHLLQPGHSNW